MDDDIIFTREFGSWLAAKAAIYMDLFGPNDDRSFVAMKTFHVHQHGGFLPRMTADLN